MEKPLPYRFVPRNLDEIIGQRVVKKALKGFLSQGFLPSLIFYGPPGVGKTITARLLSSEFEAQLIELNAATSGVKELRDAIDKAISFKKMGLRSILFIDEIYHFNKLQQDILMPYLERGDFIFIATTVHNPFFEINAPIISRVIVFNFELLSPDELRELALRAMGDKRGLGGRGVSLSDEALDLLVRLSAGDARALLHRLELSFYIAKSEGSKTIEKAHVDIASGANIIHDKDADMHYSVISAFIKSMRGSDPDATLYWLGRLISGGEDPRFIARRIAICAAEDVGNADPMALLVATAAMEAVERIGMPEAKIPLAQAALYIALAPKSNSAYKGIESALEDIKKGEIQPVPEHLRPGSQNYKYPHDYPEGWVNQEYMVKKKCYYFPSYWEKNKGGAKG
ncbi:MAG: replication-associated recombination protein A [Synergistetes bacterium]|nr:replication-associated recombination protein A [Synergistota bacterium]